MDNDISRLISQFAKAHEARMTAQRKADELKEAESKLEADLIAVMDAAKLQSAKSGNYTVAPMTMTRIIVTDWPKFWEQARKKGNEDLIEKRPAQTACRLRFDAGKPVAGTDRMITRRLSLTKVSPK